MKKKFALVGLGIGVCVQIAVIVFLFCQAPGIPGPFDILIIVLLTGILSLAWAATGFLFGLAVQLVQRLMIVWRD